jgi:hypothetical protein
MGLVEQDHIGVGFGCLKGITLGFMWDVLGLQIMKKIKIVNVFIEQKSIHQQCNLSCIVPLHSSINYIFP